MLTHMNKQYVCVNEFNLFLSLCLLSYIPKCKCACRLLDKRHELSIYETWNYIVKPPPKKKENKRVK